MSEIIPKFSFGASLLRPKSQTWSGAIDIFELSSPIISSIPIPDPKPKIPLRDLAKATATLSCPVEEEIEAIQILKHVRDVFSEAAIDGEVAQNFGFINGSFIEVCSHDIVL